MARDGLLTNGDWVLPSAARAAKHFSDPRLDLPAQCLAAMHRYAIDYIEQAPLLVVAAAAGRDFLRRGDRLEVLRAFKAACEGGMRLPALLQSYGIAPQLRVLDGKAIRVEQVELFRALSKVHPSTLAQRIPKSVERQVAWLRCLERWRMTMGRRCRDGDLLLEWAVTNICDEHARNAAGEVADFASQNVSSFDARWNMQQAIAASQRWHAELAMRLFAAEARRPDWRRPIDYGPMPLRLEVEGYEFVALNTREALYEEGAAMQHCVRTYADRVACGQSRIYSLRQGGKRVATLELIPSQWVKGHFEYSQLRSVRNGHAANEAMLATSAFIANANASIPAPPSRSRTASATTTKCELAEANRRQLTAQERQAVLGRGAASRAELCGRLGQEVYMSWFSAMALEGFDGTLLTVSFPTRFMRNWVATHYTLALRDCCAGEFPGVERVEVVQRMPQRAPVNPSAERTREALGRPAEGADAAPLASVQPVAGGDGRTRMGGFEGSPLDPEKTLERFVTGPSNRMAHAAAMQVAEAACRAMRGEAVNPINPLFIHAPSGFGKTHLMHAIAWQVRQNAPDAQVLYLTAERFRFQFVQAMQSTDPARFESTLETLNLLLIDDLEFMSGAATEPAFERIVGAMLARGGQVVLAASQPPMQMERLSERMRMLFGRGLITEIAQPDANHRLRLLTQRLTDKRRRDPTFAIGPDVLARLAEGTENASGWELSGIVTQIHAMWRFLRRPVTVDVADHVLHERQQRAGPPAVRFDDVLREVSRHYGVSRLDILSERRHRSCVWPRQVAMYLCRKLVARGIAEICRRFGRRDPTTTLHAIRRVEMALASEASVRQEIDAIRQALGCPPTSAHSRRAA